MGHRPDCGATGEGCLMADYDDALEHLKVLRRAFVDSYCERAGDEETLGRIATIQTAIQAVEAVMAEPARTGPKVTFGDDGWPVGG